MEKQPTEQFIDLSQVLANAPLNSWIAFNKDHSVIVGQGKTLKEALDQAKEKGVDDPILFKTPDKWIPHAFSSKSPRLLALTGKRANRTNWAVLSAV